MSGKKTETNDQKNDKDNTSVSLFESSDYEIRSINNYEQNYEDEKIENGEFDEDDDDDDDHDLDYNSKKCKITEYLPKNSNKNYYLFLKNLNKVIKKRKKRN